MNEGIKTICYIGAALAVAAAAIFTRPDSGSNANVLPAVGKPLFETFKNPDAAASLEIVKVDSSIGKIDRFKVERNPQSGRWTIPSHNGYPADAENQMRDAAVMFIDIPILGIATEDRGQHEKFGVLEPDERNAEIADNAGMLVSITDKNNDSLAKLIIGKPVKGSEGQRFVRKPGQDQVYVVAIDPEKLSTNFESWIEKDLLKLNAFDIERVKLQDYSMVAKREQNQIFLEQNKRLEVDLRWDSEKAQWQLENMLTFRPGDQKPIPTQMSPEDELNSTKLNELKNALDDLQIVDVLRKPEGLTANLKAQKGIMDDMEAIQSLIDKGFYPLRASADGEGDLKAAHGEVRVSMKDGVDYILRFGNSAGSDKSDSEKFNRYLFVSAEFDESRIPLPPMPAAPAASTAPPVTTAPATTPPTEASPATGEQPASSAEAAPATDAPATTPPATEPPPETSPPETSPPETGEAPQGESCTVPQETEPATTPAVTETPAPATQPAATQPAAEGQPAQPPVKSVEDEAAATQREKAQKEYQQKLDDRNKKVKEAKEKVRELNNRFADWYYVISEDNYKKIHLGRAELFKEKSAEGEEGTGVDAFRKLEKEGIKAGAFPSLPTGPGSLQLP